jgi:hypothetical protein
METCPLEQRHRLQTELDTISQHVALGISQNRAASTDSTWLVWTAFCNELQIDPTLQDSPDNIIPLQLFAHRYRCGQISPSQTPVRGKTVGDAVRSVGQTLANLGYSDPRLLPSGKLSFRLSRQLSYYTKSDPPPSRVKPIPTPVLHHTIALHCLANNARSNAIADMLTLGFYFLLRPGEYAQTDNAESMPFRLCDVHLHAGPHRLAHLWCALPSLDSATFVCLEFTNQKNGVRGELIGLGRSGNPTFCPVQACINRVKPLRQFNAPPTTPLYAYFLSSWLAINTSTLTKDLRRTVDVMGHTVGLLSSDISIRSLRSSGAMALLCANVDTDRIRLLGRWRSDEMLRYLHVQAYPVVAHLAPAMLQHGHFQLLPNQPHPPPRFPPVNGG